MRQVYISNIQINKVRHLTDIEIPLSDTGIKHLILTGKNGSGKTSLLDALADFLNAITTTMEPYHSIKYLAMDEKNLKNAMETNTSSRDIEDITARIQKYRDNIDNATHGVWVNTQPAPEELKTKFENGEFMVAYYKADRAFTAIIPDTIQKIELKENYKIGDAPRKDFVKYLLDLKVMEAMSIAGKKEDKAKEIQLWFNELEKLLRRIFEDESLVLDFDEETYKFHILVEGREPFDFNTLSSGYSAIMDIVMDIIVRMQKQVGRVFEFKMPGIVLIDEIDTHLHLELQKNILDLLTTLFPNVQFIVSTHSPFVLNSLENVVIYDMENHTLVENGLSDVPYSGIVEGYFKADELSNALKKKFERYKKIITKDVLSDNDLEEIARLTLYLDEIPDYLALPFTTEYQRLKLEFENRGDIEW